MPIVNGNYRELTADEIRNALETELQNEFGTDIDLTQSSVFSTLVDVLATVLSNNQEASLAEVYESAFLDTATGIDLDRVVAIIGIQRRPAIHATGVQRFEAAGPVTQDFIIQGGTQVQTDSESPTIFETQDPVRLELVDSFEDGDLVEYSGDTANASVIADANAPDGDNVAQLDATAGAHIYNDSIELHQGTTLHGHVRPQTGTVPILTFGVQSDDASDHYQIAADEAADEVRLERVVNGAVDSTLDTLTGAGLTAGSFHEIEWTWTITDNINVTVYDPNGDKLGVLSANDSTYKRGGAGFKSGDANGTKEFDWYTTSAVSADIRALTGGVEGNVGANSITVTPSPPNGVDTTTNLYPTGSTEYENTHQEDFRIGRDEERDEELRDRARESVTAGGAATHDALVSSLIEDVTGVTSVKVYENKTDTDNTGTGGLPPHSFEAVVFGGDDQAVGKTIFDTKAITSRDYSGVYGTSTSVTVQSDVNDDTRTIEWSRPTKVDVDITLDIVIDESYIGDEALRDAIVRYIGGTLSNGSSVVGLGVGEDVRIDQLRDIVVGDDTGVIGFDQSVDGAPIETTPSTTTVGGLNVVDIGATEVAQSDSTDTSITINKTEI